MQSATRSLAVLALLGSLAAPALASELKLDGVAALSVPYGGAFEIELTGGPGLLSFVLFDHSPGPTLFLGELVPLGFTPQMNVLVFGTSDATGVFDSPFFLPENPSYAGATAFLAGALLDPSDPNGFDVSNGATLNVVPKVGAGAAQTTLVGRRTALDGSGAALADGTLALGTSVLWELVARPPGSAAELIDAGELYPSLVPDVAGDYTARLTATKAGASSSAETEIHAYRVALAPALDGQYVITPSASVQGTIEGPPGVSASLNGAPIALAPTGAFGPLSAPFAPGEVFLPLVFELAHPGGSATRERFTVAQGLPLPLSFPSLKALSARVQPGGYNALEGPAAELLASTDIESLLLASGPVLVAYDEGPFGLVIFSATVQFLGLDHGAITADLAPIAGGASGAVRIFSVGADFRVYGKVLGISYDLTGDMSANPALISASLGLAPSAGKLQASLQSISVDLQSFQFNLDGFLGGVAELFVIESSVQEQVEAAVADAIAAELPSALAKLLSSFVIEGNLFETLEVDVDVAAPITGVVAQSSGTTIQLDGAVAVGAVEPGSPPVAQYRSTLTAAPSFGATTPLGASYAAGLAVGDDFLNQVLAAATAAGLLDGDMTTLLAGTKGAGEIFYSDALATLFPGAGFEKFPAGTPVGLRSHGTLPPIVRTLSGGGALGRIDVADLEAVFAVDGPSGPIPVLRVTIDAGAELDLDIDGSGSMVALLRSSSVDAQSLQGMSGSNLSLLNAGIDFLSELLVPQLAKLFGGIPLPSLEAQGIGLLPSEVSLIGAELDYAGFFGGLVLLPADF